MPSRMKQIFVYTRLTAIIVLFVAIMVIVFENRNNETDFWPVAKKISTVWLILATAAISIIAAWIFSKTRRVLKDLSQLRAEEALQMKAAETERLRKSLADQERRIDEKLQRAVGPDTTPPR